MLNVQQVERDLIVQSHFNQNSENVGSAHTEVVGLLYLQIVVWCCVNVQNPIYLTLSCPLRNIQIKVVFFLVARHRKNKWKQVCSQAEKFMSAWGQIKKSLYCYTCSLECCWEQTSNTEQKKVDLKKKTRRAPNQVLTNMPRPFFSRVVSSRLFTFTPASAWVCSFQRFSWKSGTVSRASWMWYEHEEETLRWLIIYRLCQFTALQTRGHKAVAVLGEIIIRFSCMQL